MDDLLIEPANAPIGQNIPEYSVSQISAQLKRTVEGQFAHIRVKGEIGRISRPASGHVYLDIKDDRAVLSAVIWKGAAANMPHPPTEGMEVIATGRLTTFAGQSKYQLIIESIAPAGAGALMAMLEQRKAALTAEGLFAPDRKKPIPFMPRVIGVITSPSGAVIRDILHRLRARFPCEVIVWPAACQGAKCASEISNAIKGMNALPALSANGIPRPDVLIVARGGGSLEDLWGFNEESVVRAVAASDIPLISAIGHETDTTLIDYAADLRAPTPTAAAELAVPVRADLLAALADIEQRRLRALTGALRARGQRLADLSRALPNPMDAVRMHGQRVDMMESRLYGGLLRLTQNHRNRLTQTAARLQPRVLRMQITRQTDRVAVAGGRLSGAILGGVADRRRRLDGLERLLDTLGYKATLRRGYAVVRGEGVPVALAGVASGLDKLEIEFSDGKIAVQVDK